MKLFMKISKNVKGFSFAVILVTFFIVAIFRPDPGTGSEPIEFLMDLFVILLSTKVFSICTRKMNIPAVVGALIAGLVFGPAMLNRVQETEFITTIAELGVIILMFTAGLETDIRLLKKCGKSSFLIAVLGVVLPLVLGFGFMCFYNNAGGFFNLTYAQILQNIFMGVILTATSVSITVEVLKELGTLNTKVGNTILAAALIDDVLGIIALTLVTSLADPSVSIILVIVKIVLFFIFTVIVGYLASKVYTNWMEESNKCLQRHVVLSFCLCLALAYIAEAYFGVADITGAFFAGVILSNIAKEKTIEYGFETLSFMLLSPVFFASIGLRVQLAELDMNMLIFTILLTIVALLTKALGCYAGAKISRYSNREAIQVGVGMMARGEVALIIADKGAALGLMKNIFFAPIIIMVIFVTIVTPIILKLTFKQKK